jgi:hypothetical protein
MDLALYFGFYLVLFGIIAAVLFMLKSPPSKKKKIIKSEAEVQIKKYNEEEKNIVSRGFTLIPDSILGVGFYILIILFCIWFFGDYGGECGVDYAPRFFGEC